MDFSALPNLFLLILGFGFVIFWHELGHFLAAKWAGVRVEQFAVGFGQALLCWRKGLGLTMGTGAPLVQKRVDEARDRGERGADDEIRQRLGLGETEYRLNWIPLGGYVKMLGQDDMDPNASSPDPRAYNNKSVGKRMVIISAGVIMNVILAGLLFCVLFLWGFTAPSPVVGGVQAGSPAQRAGLLPGDRVLRFDGATMHDFTKIRLATALAAPAEPVEVVVLRDGKEITLKALPVADRSEAGFLQMGVLPPVRLQVWDDPRAEEFLSGPTAPPQWKDFKRGDRIVAVDGVRLDPSDAESAHDRNWATFDRVVQQSFGRPITVTVVGRSGDERTIEVRPVLGSLFGRRPPTFAGMQSRTQVAGVQPDSAARGRVMPGDAIARVSIDGTGDAFEHPTHDKFLEVIASAVKRGATITVEVQRGDERLTIDAIALAAKIGDGAGPSRRGVGLSMELESGRAVVASVDVESPAGRAGIRAGDTIAAISGQPVAGWSDVHRLLSAVEPGRPIEVIVVTPSGERVERPMTLSSEDLAALRGLQYVVSLPLMERTEKRQTANPLVAMAWGVGETRDMIVQFYVVLKRMAQRTVSPSNMSGPVGILHHGTIIASRGTDWMIWYLAMISANLAVVNFLPLPIVDGGHFVFLLVEKIRGRPASQRVMVVTQLLGLALIVGVFLFVTYNDIMRLL